MKRREREALANELKREDEEARKLVEKLKPFADFCSELKAVQRRKERQMDRKKVGLIGAAISFICLILSFSDFWLWLTTEGQQGTYVYFLVSFISTTVFCFVHSAWLGILFLFSIAGVLFLLARLFSNWKPFDDSD